jgi:hypothetical protein
MVTTKIKDLIPETAKQLGLPEEHLYLMYSFYTKENKKLLSNMTHLHLTLRGLGRMTIKGWEITRQIEELKRKVERAKSDETVKENQEKLKVFENVLPKWEEQEKRKMETKRRKQEYYKNKETKDDTQRQTSTGLE